MHITEIREQDDGDILEIVVPISRDTMLGMYGKLDREFQQFIKETLIQQGMQALQDYAEDQEDVHEQIEWTKNREVL